MAAMAPGILAGPPVAGAILAAQSNVNSNSGVNSMLGAMLGEAGAGANGGANMNMNSKSYLGLQMFCGGMLVLGAVFAVAARVACERRVWVRV